MAIVVHVLMAVLDVSVSSAMEIKEEIDVCEKRICLSDTRSNHRGRYYAILFKLYHVGDTPNMALTFSLKIFFSVIPIICYSYFVTYSFQIE